MTRAADVTQQTIDQLRDRMIRDGVTQTDLARRTGLGKSRISDILRGRYRPTLDTVCRLASGLGLDVRVELVGVRSSREGQSQ